MSDEKATQDKVKGLLAGFKEFLMRGNVVELAVAVVVGSAFSKIVDAIVKGLINPLVGAFGTMDLEKYQSCLKDPCKVNEATGVVEQGIPIKWGPILSASLTFLMTAAVVYFLMILPMNKLKERRAAKAGLTETPNVVTEIELLTEIRDALVAQRSGGVPSGSSTDVSSGEDDVSRPAGGRLEKLNKE